MADKNWQAGGKIPIRAWAVPCLIGIIAPFNAVFGASDAYALQRDISPADPNVIWEQLIGGIVVCSFVAAVALWILAALRKVKHADQRRSAFISSALNNLSHGVVMTDAQKR